MKITAKLLINLIEIAALIIATYILFSLFK